MDTQETANILATDRGAEKSFDQLSVDQSLRSSDTASLATASISIARPLAGGSVDITVGTETGQSSFELKRAANGMTELLVTAESAAVRFGTALWVAASTLAKKPAFTAAAAALGLGTVAEGALIPDGASDAAYVNYGASMEGKALWLQVISKSGTSYLSAAYLDPYDVLTAGHAVSNGTASAIPSNLKVGTGSNFNSDQGTVVTASSFTVYPGYDGTFNGPDLAIIHLSQPIGTTSMNISGVSLGETVTEAGFGHPGTPSSGILPTDGNSRAWNADISAGNTSNVSNTYYFSTDFASAENVPMNGKGLSGDSGGPVFSPTGDLVGIGVGEFGGTDQIGGTEIAMLSQPDIYSWIQANESVPEPSAISIAAVGVAGALMRRARGS